MTNDLLLDWNLRTKFVDDTTALEIILRNSISLLDVAANMINDFAVSHNMKLNPAKCKEMLINFMQDPNFLLKPINLANRTVQQVSCFKLLGVYLSDDLYLNIYITNVCPRALDSSRGLRYIYYYIRPDRHIVTFTLILQSSRQIYRNTHNKLIKQRKMIAMTKLKKTLRFPNVLLNILKYHSIVFEF